MMHYEISIHDIDKPIGKYGPAIHLKQYPISSDFEDNKQLHGILRVKHQDGEIKNYNCLYVLQPERTDIKKQINCRHWVAYLLVDKNKNVDFSNLMYFVNASYDVIFKV